MAIFFKEREIEFKDHPKFAGVKIAILVSSKDTDRASISLLCLHPGVEIPIHTHDPQVDSIYVLSGEGEAYVNGSWQKIEPGDYLFIPPQEEHGVKNTGEKELKLFIVHSPPLF